MHFNGCRACPSYNRGAGTETCFKCARYKEITDMYTDRETIRVVHIPSALIEEVADHSHQDFSMLQAIRKLDPKEMCAALMRYYGNATMEEIGQAMNLSDRQVKRITKSAMSSLKIIINERGSSIFFADEE